MVRNKYYHQSWAPDGIDPNILENTFGSQIEPKGKLALEKILSWDENITKRDWADFVIYLVFQNLRTPKKAEFAKEMMKSFILINGDPEAAKLVFEGKLKINIHDSVRFEFMKAAGSQLHRWYLRMEWEIIRPADSEFLTSDTPVTYFNPEVLPPLEPGLAQAGTVVFFPLRRDRLLLMRHPEALADNVDLLGHVSEHNPNPEGTRVSERITWPRDQVIRHNKLMLKLADRIVAANSKDLLDEVVGKKLAGNNT